MAEPLDRAWSLDEFFAWQERRQERFELVNGRPLRMMAGAKDVHDDIVVNILAALVPQVRAAGCRSFTGADGVETYPGQIRRADVGVDGGQRDPHGHKAVSPRLLLEVLSPSTRDFNSIAKLAEYKTVAGLNYILFVEPNEPAVTVWSRPARGAWTETHVAGLRTKIDLPALGARLDMSAIYDGVTFPVSPRLTSYDPPR